MLNKPIDIIVKDHFTKTRNSAKQKAEIDFKKNVLEKIEGLDNYEKLFFFSNEVNRVEKLIEQDPHPYYVKNSDDWLLTQFASRQFLLNVDETDEFFQSVYLGDYDKLIYKEIEVLKVGIPKFTYKDFLKGKQCKYFENIDSKYNIEEKDFFQIIHWQKKALLDIVEYDTTNIVRTYQEYCKTLEKPLKFIANQFALLKDELCGNFNNPEGIKKILKNLYFFKDFDFSVYDNQMLLINFKLFFNDKNNLRKLNPKTLKEPLIKIDSNSKSFIGNELTIFHTLNFLQKWMHKIIKDQSLSSSFKIIDTDKELQKALEEAEEESQKVIDEIHNYCYFNEKKSNKKIKKYLRSRFDEQIDAYNKIQQHKIFLHLKGDDCEFKKTDLKFDYLINDKLQEVLKETKMAYKIQNISFEISSIFHDLFDGQSIYNKNGYSSQSIMRLLINKMVVGKELYYEIESSMDMFLKRIFSDSLPIDFHMINLKKTSIRVLEKSMSRFEKILDNAEPNSKLLYIQSRLKELKLRELKFRNSLKKFRDFKINEDEYPKLFKEFLTIQAEFIKESATNEPIDYTSSNKKKTKSSNSISLINREFKTFIPNEKKQEYIYNLLEHFGAINSERKSVLTTRKKGVLRGVVEALIDCKVLPQAGLHNLCLLIAKDIGLDLQSKLEYRIRAKNVHFEAKHYIKDNPFY